MRAVPLSELRNMDYSLRHVIAHMQYWRESSNWIIQEGGRVNTAVMVILGVEADYMDVGTREVLATATPGDLVVIPQGMRYEFYARKVIENGADLSNLPDGNYYWDGVKRDGAEGVRTANVIFMGFEMLDAAGLPFTLGSRIEVFRFSQMDPFYKLSERVARLSGSGFTPPALIISRMYDLLTMLSETTFKKRPRSIAYRRIEAALLYMDNHPVGTITVGELSGLCSLSPSSFGRLFRQEMGESPVIYLQKRTLERARELLSVGDLSISEVALECGFQDMFYFSRFFRKWEGMSPSVWRKKRREEKAVRHDE
ncbi:MAG: helix-turn-helix transcriptional regulator [Clostridiales bacterium]|nr:helix-turn-helix transcriptional regulator [Clostridiales bacterium]